MTDQKPDRKPDVSTPLYDCYETANGWRVIPSYADKWGTLAGPTNRIEIKEDANKSLTPK